jgi:hypothetical protein
MALFTFGATPSQSSIPGALGVPPRGQAARPAAISPFAFAATLAQSSIAARAGRDPGSPRDGGSRCPGQGREAA